jgi:Uma2 family endonuclease
MTEVMRKGKVRLGYEPYGINPETGVEEELGQNTRHAAELRYLIAVLENYYRGHKTLIGVAHDLPLHTGNARNTVSPDISIIEGLAVDPRNVPDMANYQVGVDGPRPRLVIEVASRSTWQVDLEDKVTRYAGMGIPYYIAYDPYPVVIWEESWANRDRLIVWQLNPATQSYVELPKDANGRVWCEELESWLAVEGPMLMLYTADGQERLTWVDEARQEADAIGLERDFFKARVLQMEVREAELRQAFAAEKERVAQAAILREQQLQQAAEAEKERVWQEAQLRVQQLQAQAQARETELQQAAEAEKTRILDEAAAREQKLQEELAQLRAQLEQKPKNGGASA